MIMGFFNAYMQFSIALFEAVGALSCCCFAILLLLFLMRVVYEYALEFKGEYACYMEFKKYFAKPKSQEREGKGD